MSRRSHPHFYKQLVLNWVYRKVGTRRAAAFLDFVGGVSSWFAVSFLVLIGFADPEKQTVPQLLSDVAAWLWAHRFTLACWLLAVQAAPVALIWTLSWFLTKSPDQDKVKRVLDELATRHFKSTKTGCVYRATLFRARTFWWCGMWLGIIARSGALYTRCGSFFSIDENHHECCTGIAGECWWRAMERSGASFCLVLPDCRSDPTQEFTYKQQGFIDDREFRHISKHSTYFRTADIRTLSGQVWGVLILDSDDPDTQPPDEATKAEQENSVREAASQITLMIE